MKRIITLVFILSFSWVAYAGVSSITPPGSSGVTGLTDASNVAITGGNVTVTTVTGATLTDGTVSITTGNLTGAANVTATGTVRGGTLTDGTISISNGVISGIATTSSAINTGTSTTSYVTPDALAGSNLGIRYIQLLVANGTALTVGDGKAFFRIPSGYNGMDLISVAAHAGTASSANAITLQVFNVSDNVDMLSTALTIDANENDSSTAATAAVINSSYKSVSTGDWIRIDCDGAGTNTAWVAVEAGFQLP